MVGSIDELLDGEQAKGTLVDIIGKVTDYHEKQLKNKAYSELEYLDKSREFIRLYNGLALNRNLLPGFRKRLGEEIKTLEIPSPSLLWSIPFVGGIAASITGGVCAIESPRLLFCGLATAFVSAAIYIIQDRDCGKQRDYNIHIIDKAHDETLNAALDAVYLKRNFISPS